MPPPLSEAWATAYVQILITLVVFALGIPALAIQLVVQDDIREVFHRRMRITGWVISLIIIIVTFIAFVWFLHPPFNKEHGGASAAGQASADKQMVINLPLAVGPSAQAGQRSGEQSFAFTVGTPTVISPEPEAEDSNHFLGSLAASVIMTLIPLVLIGLGLLQTTYLRRRSIIKELEDELIEDFCEDWPSGPGWRYYLKRLRNWFFKKGRANKKGRARRPDNQQSSDDSAEDVPRPLKEDTLNDLIYLGQHGKAGRDKKLVLDSLNHIAYTVQSSPKYQGGELEDLIPGLKEILLNGEKPGSDEDFNDVVEILKSIRYRLSQKEHTSKYLDAGLASKMLEELGIEAVKSKSARTAGRFLEEAASSSEIVFRVGRVALSNKQFHMAILALTKLESLAENKNLVDCPETFDLLGLIAHFTTSGTAARMRAEQFLLANIQAFSPSIDVCLQGAYEHYYTSGDFETADKVFDLRQEVEILRRSSRSFSSL